MFRFLFLSHSRHHPVDFSARAFDLAPRLCLSPGIHLRQGFGEPPAGATQDGNRHLQVMLECDRGRPGSRRRPLRFQKQLRLGQDALAHYVRTFAPCGIELPGLPRVAAVLGESGRHPLTMLYVHSRHRHQILHGQLCAQRSFAHLLLDGFGEQLD
jgi:hypothetical protein